MKILDCECLRCDYCGRYIGLDEFDDGTARRILVQPDNEFGGEEYETYHLGCRKENINGRIPYVMGS